MTAFWDQREREIHEAGTIEEAIALEKATFDIVTQLTGDREFPNHVREQALIIMATKSISDCPKGIPGGGRRHYEVAKLCQAVSSLHCLWHFLAEDRITTRFGLLTDSPDEDLRARDKHDSD